MNRRHVIAAASAATLASTGALGARPSSVRPIAIEEACLPESLMEDWERVIGASYPPEWRRGLSDITHARLAQMDRAGVDMMVLSLTVPGPQGEPDPLKAQALARRGNDELAKVIANHPKRFAALGCLAMQDAEAACRELERVVHDLGMSGVLLNNVQRAGPEGETFLFYDQPQYDPFWALAGELGAPVYLHPNLIAPSREQDLVGFDWLRDAAWNFAVQTGAHALRIITSGVFDRHPAAQLILGHNGEHIVHDLWRIDNRIHRRSLGYRARRPVRDYFKTNVHVATSGQFSTASLQHVIAEIGVERILFAIDTPYEDCSAGAEWLASAEITAAQRLAIGRTNAIKLLNLRAS